MTRLVLCLLLILSVAQHAWPQPLRVAVAANAQFVIKALQADFKTKTGIETEAIIGSSGKLAAQIKNGAPFDIFLSADMEYPANLYKEGFGTGQPKEYALGSLIVCSNQNLDVKNWRQLLLGNDIKKIAVANPALAPYGRAAEEALRFYGLWDKLQSKLVFGESVSQVNTYITTGVVSLGFTTEALPYEYPDSDKLKWVRIDEKMYGKISQGMIVLKHAKKGNYEKAMKFFQYISSPSAKKLFRKFGYRST